MLPCLFNFWAVNWRIKISYITKFYNFVKCKCNAATSALPSLRIGLLSTARATTSPERSKAIL